MLKLNIKQKKFKVYFKQWIKKNWISFKSDCFKLRVGRVGFVCLEACKLQLYQLNVFKRNSWVLGKQRSLFWFPFFLFNVPVSKKPFRSRMGKGKGEIDYWCVKFLIGVICVEFELQGFKNFRYYFANMRTKLPMQCKLIWQDYTLF